MKIAFTIFFLNIFFLSGFAQMERKFQIWNKNEITFQPWKNISIDFAEKIHYAPRQNTIELKYAELFLTHEPKKWLEYGAGFRIAQSFLYPGWLQENRSMFFADFSNRIHLFSLKFSNRMEFRSYPIGISYFRYKQSFTVTSPPISPMDVKLYTSEESFFKLNGIGVHLARIYAGLSALNKEHYHLKIYYAFEKSKLLETWYTTDIVGCNMGFSF
jgi:hypothetical protein